MTLISPNVGRLAERGDLEGLSRAASHSRSKVRLAAVVAMGELGDQRAAGSLVTRLADPDEQVRIGAATALGRVGAPESARPLRNALSDPDPGVRHAAAESLLRLAPASVSTLV